MKKKMVWSFFLLFMLTELKSSVYENLSIDIKNELKGDNITCKTSLILSDEDELEDEWIQSEADPSGGKKPEGLPNPSMRILSKIKTYEKKDGSFTLRTNGVIADVPTVLGSLPTNITNWEINCLTPDNSSDGTNGQTMMCLPKTVKTVTVLINAFLFATMYKPITVEFDQIIDLSKGGQLYVQLNGMLEVLNPNNYSYFSNNLNIYGSLSIHESSFSSINMSWFKSQSSIMTHNVLTDDENGVGKIPSHVKWIIMGGTESIPQYAKTFKGGDISVFGFLVSDSSHKIDNKFGKITVLNGGTLKIVGNQINMLEINVEEGGRLQLSKTTADDLKPLFPINVMSGGTLKIDENVVLSSDIKQGKINIYAGAIIDFPSGWRSFNPQYLTMSQDFLHFPITLQTRNFFDLSNDENRKMLAYNSWNVGNNNQTFSLSNVLPLNMDAANLNINILPGTVISDDLNLFSSQNLKRDDTASMTGKVVVYGGAQYNIGTKNFNKVNSDLLSVLANGTLIIGKTYEFGSKSKVDYDAVINWENFELVDFAPLAYFWTFTLFQDDSKNVGFIESCWLIGADRQTAHYNNNKITSITILPGCTFYSPNLTQFQNYPALAHAESINTSSSSFTLCKNQKMFIDKMAKFFLDPGSFTTIEKGSKISATTSNVIIFSDATVQTDVQKFSTDCLQSEWFKAGSILNTTSVFKEDGKIPFFVKWNIFSKDTPETSLDFQQAANASAIVRQITIKSGAYVGVEKNTSFLLCHDLFIEQNGTLEVLEGGEFVFAGGILNRLDPLYKITVNYGGKITVASYRYTLAEVLSFVSLEYGSILAFGDAYQPANVKLGTPVYPGLSYMLADDKYGLGLIPEGISSEFVNGVQTLLNVHKTMRNIAFKDQGILAVERDYPFSLYSGQTLDLTESDFDNAFSTTSENRYPYRMFIRSGSTLFLQSGARIKDYTNMYTILGVNAPIYIKTDAEIMDDIPGFKRWVKAIKSTVNYVGATSFLTLDDTTQDLFKGANTDMNEFTSTQNGRLNLGADLQLTTTNTVFDNAKGVGAIPFFTWNIGSQNDVYDQGQTIGHLSPIVSNYLYSVGGNQYLKTINILDGAYVFSIPNYELNVKNWQGGDRVLNILKGGTLFITEDSLNAVVNSLYLCAGSNLIVDGKLTVKNITVEVGANISGKGQIKIGTNDFSNIQGYTFSTVPVPTTNYTHIDISEDKSISITSDYEHKSDGSKTENSLIGIAGFDNPNFSNADYQNIDIVNNGVVTFTAGSYIVNNENALINVRSGGVLTIDNAAKVKNLGDITAFQGGKITTNSKCFMANNILQSWLGIGSILETTVDFDDGIGAIGSIPTDVTWNINATQTTNMGSFPPLNIVVKSERILALTNSFTLSSKQKLVVLGRVDCTSLLLTAGSVFDLTNAPKTGSNVTGDGDFSCTIESGGMMIDPWDSLSQKTVAKSGTIIKNLLNYASFPTFKSGSTNINWFIATPSSTKQVISTIPSQVGIVRVLYGAYAQVTLPKINADKKLILEKNSTVDFTTSAQSPLIVEGTLEILNGASFSTPYIKVVSGGKLIVDGQFTGLTHVTIEGGSLLGASIIPDSATSILAQIDNGETFEIGSSIDQ